MNGPGENALLKNFFSAYFHEDWPYEAATPEEVVKNYAKGSVPAGQLSELSEAVRRYANRFDSDAQLEEHLFSELGCYYRPSLDGRSAREWLREVASILVQT